MTRPALVASLFVAAACNPAATCPEGFAQDGTRCVPTADARGDADLDGATDADVADADPCATCEPIHHAVSVSCNTGRCVVTECDSAWGDCNDDASDGCEESLTELDRCGACDEGCTAGAHVAEVSCESGACEVVSCEALYGDCNDRASDGCETMLTSAQHCGACYVGCGALPEASATSCETGVCLPTSCAEGWALCDGEGDPACDALVRYFVDADEDGFGDADDVGELACAAPDGKVANDEDCADADDRAFPYQVEYFATARAGGGGFDFDCDGIESKEDVRQYTCVECSGNPGWVDAVPGCGGLEEWRSDCKFNVPLDQCVVWGAEMRNQGCR